MRFHYDKEEDALYIRFDESPYRESDEVEKGVILDYDKKGKIIGLEVLDASKKFSSKFRNALRRDRMPLFIGSKYSR